MRKIIQYTIVIVLILLFLWKCQPVLKAPVAALYSTTLPTPEIDSTQLEKFPMADFDLHVVDLEGNSINMEDYRGKVIFLNFWATWCMPCVAELPSIDNLYEEFKDENIVFLLISNEDSEKVKSYKHRKDYNVPFLIQNNTSRIPRMYHSTGIPTTFIISKEGKIIKASSGAEDWDDDDFVKVVRELL